MSLKLIALNVIIFSIGAASVYVSKGLADIVFVSAAQLREVRVESQRVQQAITILENAEQQELVGSLDSSLNELKISIAEFVSDKQLNLGVSDVDFQMDIRRAVLLPKSIYPIRLLRLIVKFKADNSIVLSEFLKSTKTYASPWPAEVKACEVHRLEVNKLWVNCVLDIYHWGLNE